MRLTHWSFALLIPAMWLSAENSQWAWHKRMGLVLLGLLVFRILWGFFGTRTARFSSFVKGPGAIMDYFRGRSGPIIGHSPLAALSVVGLLGVMLVQVGAGLFAGDPYDGATGPLNSLASIPLADALTQWHTWFYWVVLGMVALHLAAIAYYGVVKQDDLVSPMFSGQKTVRTAVEENDRTNWIRFLVSSVLAFGAVIWVASGAPPLE